MRFRPFFLLIVIVLVQTVSVEAQQEPVDLYASNSIEATGNIGSIEIKVNKFTDIISFQASINWDPSLLVFVGVSDFGIADLNADNFGTTDAGIGHVRFVWEPSNATALTIADSTTLFTAQFEFIPSQPQEVPVTFTDITSDPIFPIEFANSGYEVLTVNTHDGSITFFDEITGVENLYHAGINIYPNPFDEFIHISNEDGDLDFIKVYDVYGRQMREIYNIKNKFIDLHLTGSPVGIYFINISKDGKLLTRKVVKNLSR